MRRAFDEESRTEIQSLRQELATLRETLQALLGGEVLVERYALQAEATRMRSLSEDSRSFVGRQNGVKRLSPSQQENSGRPEEMIVPWTRGQR